LGSGRQSSQSIFIDPKMHLLIVTNRAWPEAQAILRYLVHDTGFAQREKCE